MKNKSILLGLLIVLFFNNKLLSQTIPTTELIFLTSEWKGDRFDDGRPKIPDDLLKRARNIGIDDAWTVLKNLGYTNQFESGWKMVNDSIPVIGRALTAAFMPSRPDVEKSIKDRGITNGRSGNTNSWPIDILSKGDVYVADGFGKINAGTLMGSTLGNSIYSNQEMG